MAIGTFGPSSFSYSRDGSVKIGNVGGVTMYKPANGSYDWMTREQYELFLRTGRDPQEMAREIEQVQNRLREAKRDQEVSSAPMLERGQMSAGAAEQVRLDQTLRALFPDAFREPEQTVRRDLQLTPQQESMIRREPGTGELSLPTPLENAGPVGMLAVEGKPTQYWTEDPNPEYAKYEQARREMADWMTGGGMAALEGRRVTGAGPKQYRLTEGEREETNKDSASMAADIAALSGGEGGTETRDRLASQMDKYARYEQGFPQFNEVLPVLKEQLGVQDFGTSASQVRGGFVPPKPRQVLQQAQNELAGPPQRQTAPSQQTSFWGGVGDAMSAASGGVPGETAASGLPDRQSLLQSLKAAHPYLTDAELEQVLARFESSLRR